jgi:hypothetical protein
MTISLSCAPIVYCMTIEHRAHDAQILKRGDKIKSEQENEIRY